MADREQEEKKLQEAAKWAIEVDRRTFTLRVSHRSDPLARKFDVVRVYGVAIGAAGFNTPKGYHIINTKVKNPDWRMPYNDAWVPEELQGTIIPGGDPRNPLLARWLGVTEPAEGIGIHGTAARSSIGSAASHGCIRMLEEDVIELYNTIPIGTILFVD